jgi:hypothetical protein
MYEINNVRACVDRVVVCQGRRLSSMTLSTLLQFKPLGLRIWITDRRVFQPKLGNRKLCARPHIRLDGYWLTKEMGLRSGDKVLVTTYKDSYLIIQKVEANNSKQEL